MVGAIVSARGAARWANGHPWIYRSDVVSHPPTPGVVPVHDTRQRFLGQALCSPASEIRLRLLDRTDRPIDGAWWRERLIRARDRRVGIDANSWREVHAEGDGLPSLIVDRYDQFLVAQLLSAGLETQRDLIVEALVDVFAPAGVLLRHDVVIRQREGLDQRIEAVVGAVPDEIEVREGAVRWIAALRTGQKTGGFLDQRDARMLAGSVTPRGASALDCFAFHGAFALHLAGQADQVTAVEISADAIERGQRNAHLNGVRAIEWIEADALKQLSRWARDGRQFDMIVVDPPAFAKSRASIPGALRGYHQLNHLALRLVAPGGSLLTASCSFHVSRREFMTTLADAARTSGRRVVLRRILEQGIDHPEVLTVPETGYLKGALLSVD